MSWGISPSTRGISVNHLGGELSIHQFWWILMVGGSPCPKLPACRCKILWNMSDYQRLYTHFIQMILGFIYPIFQYIQFIYPLFPIYIPIISNCKDFSGMNQPQKHIHQNTSTNPVLKWTHRNQGHAGDSIAGISTLWRSGMGQLAKIFSGDQLLGCTLWLWLTVCHGKSPFLIGKPSISMDNFPWLC